MSKQQLTIEHLAPYLPYMVQMYWEDFKGDKLPSYTLKPEDIRPVLEFQNKPILRPLSDLTKEIEHNGEKFVAGLKLVDPDASDWDKMTCEYYNAFPKIPNHKKWIQVKHDELGQVININPHNIGHLPYNIFQKLFEWHFDVFSLIEKGLALNLNDLKDGK